MLPLRHFALAGEHQWSLVCPAIRLASQLLSGLLAMLFECTRTLAGMLLSFVALPLQSSAGRRSARSCSACTAAPPDCCHLLLQHAASNGI